MKRQCEQITVLSLIILAALCVSHVQAGEKSLLRRGVNIYEQYCAACHGKNGNGKGFNAKNLDPRPAVHADAAFMSKRTNKELHDAITGGGRAIGKSTLMPPWGNTLSKTQVESLVLYLRKLCNCQGF